MQDNKTIVREFLAASQRADRDLMASLLDEEFVVHEADSLPYAGEHRGLEGFLALVRRVFTSFRDTRVEIDTVIGEGDTVIVLARLCGRSRHGGEAFSMPVNEVWRLRDGRIHSITPYYFDTARLNTLAGDA